MQKHILDQIDPKVLGARLAQARKARGMTQQVVADEMEVARTTVVAIEKGERRVTPEELISLAALYGRSVSDFVSKQVVTTGFVPQFRAEWLEDLKREEGLEKVGDELQGLAEDYVELERMCGLPTVKTYPPIYETSGSSPEQSAEEMGPPPNVTASASATGPSPT